MFLGNIHYNYKETGGGMPASHIASLTSVLRPGTFFTCAALNDCARAECDAPAAPARRVYDLKKLRFGCVTLLLLQLILHFLGFFLQRFLHLTLLFL